MDNGSFPMRETDAVVLASRGKGSESLFDVAIVEAMDNLLKDRSVSPHEEIRRRIVQSSLRCLHAALRGSLGLSPLTQWLVLGHQI